MLEYGICINSEIKFYDNYDIESTGFLLNYRDKTYLISITHNEPINNFNIKGRYELIPLIRPVWNELIIFDGENIKNNNNNIFVFEKLVTSIPKNDILFMYNKSDCINLLVDSVESIKLYSFCPIPSITMIKCLVTTNSKKIIKSLSGSPVFDNKNNLVGIFSKVLKINNNFYVYVIPSYYLQKTFEKINNNNIYFIKYLGDINKINNYNIDIIDKTKNNYDIYHPSLKVKVKLDSYLVLEGDLDMNLKINDNEEINYIDSDYILRLDLNVELIKENNKYLINASLLNLIKRINNEDDLYILLLAYFELSWQNEKKKSYFILNKKEKGIKYDKINVKNINNNNKFNSIFNTIKNINNNNNMYIELIINKKSEYIHLS
jgi:hypothetical protein